MPSRKTAQDAARKYVERTGVAGDDYRQGTAGAGSRMESNARAAEPIYEQGVQKAITEKRYGKGLAGAGSRYDERTQSVGAARYPEGTRAGANELAASLQKFESSAWNGPLPPRGIRNSAANRARINANIDNFLKAAGRSAS
ncbi:MAG: hypothetical protein HY471_03180 [Candidatus Sungbacteria bacterium]|nr:hypothetical protein [Candidatus Sungbacteria bacterium]